MRITHILMPIFDTSMDVFNVDRLHTYIKTKCVSLWTKFPLNVPKQIQICLWPRVASELPLRIIILDYEQKCVIVLT